MVGDVDARGVVDRVGVDPPAGSRELDPSTLGEAEVAAFADDPAAQLGPVRANRVVRLVAGVGVRLGGRLDVGADAAVPEQVDGCGQDRVDELARRQRRGALRQAQHLTHLRSHRNRLERAREHAAAFGDQRRVVVGPARPRQREHPLPLGEGTRRVRIGVEEDVPVVERRDQPDVLGEQHPVAEHVAGHVADADHGEVVLLGIHAQLAEVVLHRLPRSARSDAHCLVVVSLRPAGCERVAQPEAVVGRDGVRQIRELRRALVGGDDEIRVIAVVAPGLRRRHDLAGRVAVVGEVEHAGHERSVAVDALGQAGVPIGRVGHPLGDESALGAHRHDDRVLDHLRLDQPEDLGAEVLAAVRPPDAATGDQPEAQVHALDPWRVHPDLEPRPRLRKVRQLARL